MAGQRVAGASWPWPTADSPHDSPGCPGPAYHLNLLSWLLVPVTQEQLYTTPPPSSFCPPDEKDPLHHEQGTSEPGSSSEMLFGLTREASLHFRCVFSCFPHIPCGDSARKFLQNRDPMCPSDCFSSMSIAERAGSGCSLDQCPLQSWLEVAAHWVRRRGRHYLKLQQEIPQLDQWKSFLTVRGIKQTFKGRKPRRRWDPPPTPAPFSCLTLCPWVRTQRKTQPALELWRWAVQSPCHGPSRRHRTLWTLWIAASHPLI